MSGVVLAAFAAQVRGVLFYDYLFAGAGIGARVSLVRHPMSMYDENCIKVVLTEYARTCLLGHLDAGTAAVLHPFLRKSALLATG